MLALAPSLGELQKILLPNHARHFGLVEEAIQDLGQVRDDLQIAYEKVRSILKDVQTSIATSAEDSRLLDSLGDSLSRHISNVRGYVKAVDAHGQAMTDADQILKHELDTLAGTQDVSVLIDLLEQRDQVERKFEIAGILDDLRGLRGHVEQYVGKKMLDAVSGQLSSGVMEWYEQIRTQGDPDVHFAGFDMERTQAGYVKARRVQVKASSYGKSLVSAVSSLSESKLNALGLCISIASNLNSETPFEFLVIDDPIQSLDADHEAQCVEVIRSLVERGRQVILLSHNRGWAEQVRVGCRSVGGYYYEITAYTQSGPHLAKIPWVRWKQRLDEVDAILKDTAADSVRLQQAEEEVRIVVADLTAQLYLKNRGTPKDASKFNSDTVRKALIECGVKPKLVDNLTSTFVTTDEAHHASKDYSADRQRIRRYHSFVWELAGLVE